MADFLSDFSSNLGGKVLPNGDALNRKIDFQRDKFLKGISSTKHGKKEDPTYLHFKFIFDFGNNSLMDPETFLAPSPLFRSYDDRSYNDIVNDISTRAQTAEGDKVNPNDVNAVLSQLEKNVNNGFGTSEDFFYGSKSKIDGRSGIGFFPTGEIGYMGAQQFLYQRSVKRQKMLEAFKRGIDFINKECPYYFQTLSGLDTLLKNDIGNYHKKHGAPKRAGTLTIDCLESIDMRMFSLSELYRKAVYDYTYHRVMLPENLRKFRMWIVITELRNIQLTYGINDILNPFSIPSVAQAANFLDSFNTQTGLLNNSQGLLQRSTNTEQPGSDKFGTYEMGPYAFVYQLDQCEFDFDESYPSYSSIDNKGGAAVSSKFKIHVGKVKDYKIQFNQLADVIKKDDNIQQMVLSDVWGGKGRDIPYNDYDYTGTQGISPIDLSSAPNPAEFFAQLASNFINNSVADLRDQGVSIIQGSALGNIYGGGGINPGQDLSSVQGLVSTIQGGVPNPFRDNTPQANGLGGPGERQYPSLNLDVYPNTSSSSSGQDLGNVISNTPGNNSLSSDVYGNTPGTDLGLPERQYPTVQTDEYSNVPGPDLGIPGRVYPEPNGDLYGNTPGTDLGLPERQYPSLNDDQYSSVPGEDLGIPGRVYPEPNDDLYGNVPGSDLGLPERQYPSLNDDQYSSVPGQDLGAPDRVYSEPTGDLYQDVPGSDLGLPERQYPTSTGDEYSDVPGKDLGAPDRVYPVPAGDTDLYDDVPGADLGLPDRQYSAPEPKDEYPGVPGTDLGGIGRVYEEPKGDAYKEVPGTDLGLPSREYKTPPPKDEYPSVPGTDLGAPSRVYKVPDGDTDSYDSVPGRDLGLKEREYPGVVAKEYEFSLAKDLNLGRVYPESNDLVGNPLNENSLPSGDFNYNNIAGANYDPVVTSKSSENVNLVSENSFIGDIYNSVPGSDLGLPGRKYPTTIGRVYSKSEQIDTENLGRIYPTE
jgi:hypothetical protein